MNKVERAAGVSTKLSKNCTVTIKLQIFQVHELIWLYIDIKALMRKSTGQGLAMATGAWIQSSCLINGTACTYSKLSPLAVKLVAWLYDWAFIAHINPPSLWFLWNASDAYTPHRGRSEIALVLKYCRDQYALGKQLFSLEKELRLFGGIYFYYYPLIQIHLINKPYFIKNST